MFEQKSLPRKGFCERAIANEPPSFPLSHHPGCARFKAHTFMLGRFHFCIGCYIGYPSAVASIGVGTWLYLENQVSLFILLGIGLSCYFTLFASHTKYSEIRNVKILQKFSIGVGSGFLLIFAFYFFDNPLIIKLLVMFILLIGLLLPVRAIHLRKATKICKSCGMKGIDPGCTE
ncbi:MAG: hypothetical protein RBG13Loki_3913 [Promethearchaeota archaeon CR_4]|nr:MAG: hypothetical protein RBG13Loki_3913 [Candidatus Lokiarchaeota archaeon CR_4]